MMISREVQHKGITYTVSATTLKGLEEACNYILECLSRDTYAEVKTDVEGQIMLDLDYKSDISRLRSIVDAPDQVVDSKPAEPAKMPAKRKPTPKKK